MTNEELCNPKKVCEVLNIGTTNFYSLLRDKKMSACKLGKKTFVRRSELNRYIDSLQPYTSQNAGV